MSSDSSNLLRPDSGGMRELLYIALPMVVSHACETVMMFVDRLFLSKLSPTHMSAAMAGGLSVFLFMTFFIGLTGYTSPLVAQYLGSGKKDQCSTVVSQAVLLSLAAYPVIVLCVPLAHVLFKATGIAAEQLELQIQYFDILIYGTAVMLLKNALSAFFSGIGRTRIVMISALAAMVANVAANYVLIFGKLGFPAMGMRGAAIGTIFGSTTGLVVITAAFLGGRIRSEFDVFGGMKFSAAIMKKLLRYGSPSGIELFLNMLAFTVLVMTFHSYGVQVAGAVTIAFNWDMVSFIPLIGVNIGVMSLVGRYMGAGSPDTAHKATLSGLKMACVYAAATFTAFVLFPAFLVNAFKPADAAGDFAEVAPLAVFMVRLISIYVFGDAVAIVFSGALRGAGDTFWTMCISVGGHWTLTIAALVLVRVVEAPPRTAWIVCVSLILGIGASFLLRYRYGRWREIRVVEPVPPEMPSPDTLVVGD